MNLADLAPQVLEHAAKEQPRECCGVAVIVKGRLRYWQCKNISTHNEQFEMDPLDYAKAEDAGEVVGICHSHVFAPPAPSDADKVMCEHSGVPWLIVNYPTGTHALIEPSGYVAPLVGRQYSYGVLDCYQVVADYYKQELGIVLPDFKSQDGWWLRGENHYLDNFEKNGFVLIPQGSQIKKHDGLLMQVASPVPNHAAVYIGDGLILQHVYGRLSSRDVYGGYWQKNTTHVVRHRSQL